MKIIPINRALYGDYFNIVLWRNWLEINEEIGKKSLKFIEVLENIIFFHIHDCSKVAKLWE